MLSQLRAKTANACLPPRTSTVDLLVRVRLNLALQAALGSAARKSLSLRVRLARHWPINPFHQTVHVYTTLIGSSYPTDRRPHQPPRDHGVSALARSTPLPFHLPSHVSAPSSPRVQLGWYPILPMAPTNPAGLKCSLHCYFMGLLCEFHFPLTHSLLNLLLDAR
jgi:hypothetical protein